MGCNLYQRCRARHTQPVFRSHAAHCQSPWHYHGRTARRHHLTKYRNRKYPNIALKTPVMYTMYYTHVIEFLTFLKTYHIVIHKKPRFYGREVKNLVEDQIGRTLKRQRFIFAARGTGRSPIGVPQYLSATSNYHSLISQNFQVIEIFKEEYK